jgi:phospholipid-binding lipoprotein MlaA
LNTILGVGGLIDFADDVVGLEFHDEDFGQTLGVWGFQEGWYIMLPLYGPSNPRDLTGLVVDSFVDPVSLVLHFYGPTAGPYVRTVLTALDARSRAIDTLDEVERTSIDYYATIRSLYRQRREDEIRNGRPTATQNAPTITGQDRQAPVIEEAPQQGTVPPPPLPLPRVGAPDQISQKPR